MSVSFISTDFVLNNWKSEKGVTTMEESSIARLEEDLDMFGYLNKAADICNKTAGIFASPATGWTNGLLLINKKNDFEEIQFLLIFSVQLSVNDNKFCLNMPFKAFDIFIHEYNKKDIYKCTF